MADIGGVVSWTGEAMRFTAAGRCGSIPLNAGKGEGVGPMEALALSAAACSAADVVEILGKMRIPLDSLEVRLEGDRASEPPRRYTALRLVYRVGVAAESEQKLRHAVELSREKYCSVMHSLRPDIQLSTEIVLV
jgi:putative redox protein